ncbi:MAG: ATP-binding cassette domain-containing protein, partial [Solirubrobacteraceae bacterium]
SGGELQRTALGAALAGQPRVLVLDEPTSQLDPVAGDELLGLLLRANDDCDTTIVLSEHRLERCLSAADRVVALHAGRVVCDAPPAQFLAWAAREAPSLQTPGASLLSSLGLPAVPGVKRARSALRERGLLPERGPLPERDAGAPAKLARNLGRRGRAGAPAAALELDGVWHELRSGPAILRGASLTIASGERVALMGANGAGKSTLLRHAAGLMAPTRGRVASSGRVALLLQHPNDYLVHDTVAQEAPGPALEAVGLGGDAFAARNPRDLSGGERQRLALAIVLGELARPPAILCLDEPTRGMDRGHGHRLARLLADLGCAVLVATHDPEFVAAFAQRVVLLADGRPIADAPAHEVLCGGSWFATETARILGGAGGALTPAQGSALLQEARVGVPA